MPFHKCWGPWRGEGISGVIFRGKVLHCYTAANLKITVLALMTTIIGILAVWVDLPIACISSLEPGWAKRSRCCPE